MNELLLAGLLGALVAAGVVCLTFPFVTRVAMAVRAVDYPGGRRVQQEAIPRMGGIAVAAGIVAGASLPILLLWRQWTANVPPRQLSVLVLGAAVVFVSGIIEDVIGLSPLRRFLIQVAAASWVVYAGWSFRVLFLPFWGEIELGLLGGLAAVVWIVGVTNAINLLDGLDGLASGVAAIVATSLLLFAWIQGNALPVILMSAIVGTCLGFLRHNWAPAKIYLGDSGALTLGFLLGVTSLHASIKTATAVAILAPVLALGLPVIDTLLVMAVRFVETPQRSFFRRFGRMFQADRNHLHHLMAGVVTGRNQIVLMIYFVATCFCLMALVVAVSRNATIGVALAIVEVIVVFLMRNLGIRRELEPRKSARQAVSRQFQTGT